jgi:mitochondrial import receptor subunit TOM40
MSGPGGAQFSLENDYVGNDFTAQIKAMNPSILEGPLTGIFIGSYLQSITPRLALGLEAVYQRPAAQMGPEAMISYAAKYKGEDWIASAQLMPSGGIQGSYWRRLSAQLETGVDLNLQFAGNPMMGGMRKEGVATLGAKYDFRASSFRAQVDTAGKLGVLLEKRIVPMVQITFAGELDHVKVSTVPRTSLLFARSLTFSARTLPRSVLPSPSRLPRKRSWPNKRAPCPLAPSPLPSRRIAV